MAIVSGDLADNRVADRRFVAVSEGLVIGDGTARPINPHGVRDPWDRTLGWWYPPFALDQKAAQEFSERTYHLELLA